MMAYVDNSWYNMQSNENPAESDFGQRHNRCRAKTSKGMSRNGREFNLSVTTAQPNVCVTLNSCNLISKPIHLREKYHTVPPDPVTLLSNGTIQKVVSKTIISALGG
jgi:hypothetical protein